MRNRISRGNDTITEKVNVSGRATFRTCLFVYSTQNYKVLMCPYSTLLLSTNTLLADNFECLDTFLYFLNIVKIFVHRMYKIVCIS